MTDYTVAKHAETYERMYSDRDPGRWAFHDSQDPVVRYLRDRRLRIALGRLRREVGRLPTDWSVLVVCGGVGGEGTFLANQGFSDVTIGDFSDAALRMCSHRDPRLRTLQLNTEQLELPAESFDLLLVQDGLHELRRPVLGLTEMLRVARRAVIVIEPHRGLVSRLFGTVWENHGSSQNYVFRWSRRRFEDVVRSYLLRTEYRVVAMRLWDHNVAMARVAILGSPLVPRACYRGLDALARPLGNMFIGLVVKGPARPGAPA